MSADHRLRVMSQLRTVAQRARLTRLCALKNQGKAIECVSAVSTNGHFIRDGTYTQIADWRFIHRARLNLVPLNGSKQWVKDGDQRCRVCGYAAETLPHVLCHCRRNLRASTLRHNAIVERVKVAAGRNYTVLFENQVIPGTRLKPDLVIARGRTVLILDVTVAFENRLQAFRAAREEKVRKYAPLSAIFHQSYDEVIIDAVVVGALGSWDKANDLTLRRLCTRRYLQMMARLCCSDTIRWSREIYLRHLTGRVDAADTTDLTGQHRTDGPTSDLPADGVRDDVHHPARSQTPRSQQVEERLHHQVALADALGPPGQPQPSPDVSPVYVKPP